ncbi:MAG TPA: ATP-binding protein [Verrucomicrobiae bacterium]|nr:ATP-binding protein [Verrucomicrobiae bacterium]
MVAFESVKLFRGLPPDEIHALQGIAREINYTAGAEIFREGDPGDGVYIVNHGLVEISALVTGDTRRVFSQLGSGEIFGEMAVIEQQPRSATAMAAQDTGVYFIPREEMLQLLQRSPRLSFNVLQEISRRLREFDRFHLREVVQAERLAVLGTFARSIVHDLKTPLTIIGLSAEIGCASQAAPEQRAQSQERIRKQVRRINDMVGDILEFSRANRSTAALVPADYGDFVRELFPELQAESAGRSVRIQFRAEPPPGTVSLDARRLRRVFFNLVHNALYAMPDGGEIFLDFRGDEREIVTEIEDTGPGVAPEVADKLFQPFVTHGKEQGTGLGLSICKKIIEDHRGRIWARNERRRGAIFCFALPLAK